MPTRLRRAISCALATLAVAASLGACGSTGGGSSSVAVAGPLLEYLKASGGSVQTVGHDTIRGVPTTHYHGTIDVKKAARVIAEHAGKNSLRETFEKQVAKIGLTSIPVDVWVHSHRLVRR